MRLAANCDNLGLWIGDATRVILLAADAVDDMPFGELNARLGYGANDVDLVVFPWQVASIDVHDVVGVVQPEHGVGLVPVDVVDSFGFDEVGCHQDGK